MLIRLCQRRAQAVVGNYVIVFFVVIGAITAMTVFFRRGIQARVYDAETYMVRTIATRSQLPVAGQYEPDYIHRTTDRSSKQNEKFGFSGGAFSQSSSEKTIINTQSH
ncbi:MAG: hypothetical protein HQL21_04415 [Candidatus Omnitrophica bacterium]|nr:hypothetical protein [Candidatus Omnitrophota bacterium]